MGRLRGIVLAALCCCPPVASATEIATGIAAEKEAALARLVQQDCGSCHGLTLKGGLGRPITPDAVSHFDRESLRDVILDGIPGTAMPPWRPLLTDGEALWIADYLLEGAEE